MIRIKTFYFRQALERLFFLSMFLIISFLIIFFSILTAYFVKKEFENEFILSKENEIKQEIKTEVFSKSMFINNVLDSELSIFASIDDLQVDSSKKQNVDLEIQINSENNLATNNSDNVKQDLNLNLELVELPDIEYKIPQKYETSLLENGKIEVGNTKITNYSKLNLNLEELSKPYVKKLDSNTSFLIYHTHATECYTNENQDVSNYRTTNPEQNMISIGKAFVNELTKREFKSLHDTILHDYPNYNGSYAHSLETTKKYLKSKSFDFVLDIHRDAISSDLTYGPTTEINGEKVAQLMFVIGTDACGLEHDKWMQNLKLAITIQNRANEMYPGLFRDINLSRSRYNQHVSTGAFIIEVGTTGNTMEEAETSMKYLANVLESFK